MNLLVTVNGPGEVAGWLRPLAAAVAVRAPQVELTTVITPCQFASGREADLVSSMSGVGRVERLGVFLRRSLRTRVTGPPGAPAHLVLHLGGDPVYAIVLARLTGAAAWTYGTSARYRRTFARFLVPDERTRAKLLRHAVSPDRIEIVGQLVTDSVRTAPQPRVGTGDAVPTVVFLAGSRDNYVDLMTPFFSDVVGMLHDAGTRIRAVMLVSPFVRVERVASHLRAAGWSIDPSERHVEARSPRGVSLRLVSGGFDALDTVDMAVTIPGTNTLQLAALGLPHVVVTPGHRAEMIEFAGPLGLLKPHWPGAMAVRRAVLYHLSSKKPFLALPNIIAGETVVPEVRGDVHPPDIAAMVTSLLAAPEARRTMSERLKAVAGPAGAAARCAELILAHQASCESAS